MAARLVAAFCLLTVCASPACSSIAFETLDLFLRWNEVPTQIPLGLLSNKSDIQFTNLINGTCFQYDPVSFDRCKYYSDCCAMTAGRPLEQLDTGTFSCHSGYYIVDKCPASTGDQNLRELCEQRVESDVSIRRWPVRGVLNHVTYKNIFCVICNGLDIFDETDELVLNETRVEWWPAKIHCPLAEIESYHKDTPTHEKLIDLVNRLCKVTFYPPQSPDLCWEAVRTCPESASTEIRRLCESGPANYVNVTKVSKVFRNQFCALCNRLDSTANQQPGDLESKYSNSSWRGNKLIMGHRLESEDQLLAVLQPRLEVGNVSGELTPSFAATINVLCSRFTDETLNFCNEFLISNNNSGNKLPIWNLGSLSCFSQLHKVCDQFLVSKSDISDRCTTIGCGHDYMLDPATNKCLKVKDYRPGEVFRSLKQTWHSEILCSYRSQCRAATLGLIAEEEMNCYCDKYCIYFNDCCEDSPYQSTEESKLEQGTFSCIEDASDIRSRATESSFFWGVMEVNKCPQSYDEEHVVQLCEEAPYTARYTGVNYGLIHTPVSSSETGLRYLNIYCARCHGLLKDIHFWRVDIGCGYALNNDACRKSHYETSLEEFLIMRNNPNVDSFASRNCRVKQFLPPKSTPDPRRCRYDARKLVSDCPEYMKDWEISHQCRSAPTSFIYEGGMLSELLKGSLNFRQINDKYPYGEVSSYLSLRKFRNGYCASCNSAAWLGCHVKQSFEAELDTAKKYIQYNKDVSPFTFVYQIDLNMRTCYFDSDSFITTANYTSGFDTCEEITHQLNSCDCDSVFNLKNSSCVHINQTNHQCTTQIPVQKAWRVSSYAEDICHLNRTSLQQSICMNDNTDRVEFFHLQDRRPAVMPCPDTVTPYVCVSYINRSDCLDYNSVWGFTFGFHFDRLATKVSILNAIAISYETQSFESITATLDREVISAGFELIFDNLQELEASSCAMFSAANHSLSDFLICPDNSIVDRIDGEIHNDFLLRDNQTMICTEYQQPLFVLHIYHYVLCGLSILASIAYVLFYFAKNTKTMTGNFFASKLLTLSAALFTYCFVLTAINNAVTCRVVSSLIHYLMLSVHTWTNVLAVWMLRGIASMKIVNTHGRKTYCLYAAYAWCMPLLFVALSYILDAYPILELTPVFSDQICFLADGWIRVLLFTGPIYLQILVDVILCIYATVVVTRSGRNLNSNREREKTKRKIITVVKLQVIFGVQWFLLFFLEFRNNYIEVLWTIFNILVSIQGISIVLSQILNVNNISKCTNTLLYKPISRNSSANTANTQL